MKSFLGAESGGSFECPSDWYSGGPGFDPLVQKHSFIEIDHEIISMAILFLPLFQVGFCQLLAKGCALNTG